MRATRTCAEFADKFSAPVSSCENTKQSILHKETLTSTRKKWKRTMERTFANNTAMMMMKNVNSSKKLKCINTVHPESDSDRVRVSLLHLNCLAKHFALLQLDLAIFCNILRCLRNV